MQIDVCSVSEGSKSKGHGTVVVDDSKSKDQGTVVVDDSKSKDHGTVVVDDSSCFTVNRSNHVHRSLR